MSDPNDSLRLCVLDENDEPIEETLHVCRPAPVPDTPEWAQCMRDFAAKVRAWQGSL